MATDIISVVNELKKIRMPLPKAQKIPSDELLSSYEKDLGFIFSEDYKYFLKEANGSLLNGKDALIVTANKNSPRELFINANEAWGLGVPRDWLPICEDNGNYYCIKKSGEVVFWSHDGSSDENWKDLATWIKRVWIEEE